MPTFPTPQPSLGYAPQQHQQRHAMYPSSAIGGGQQFMNLPQPQPTFPNPEINTNIHLQAHLQLALQSLNAKIIQAQSLALMNGLTVDEVLMRMGGLSEGELGLLRLCAAKNVGMQGLVAAQVQHVGGNAQYASAGSVHEQRNAARMMVERNLQMRRQGPGQTSAQENWQGADDLGFGGLSLGGSGLGSISTPVKSGFEGMNGGNMMTPPTSATRAFSGTRTGRISPTGGSSFNGNGNIASPAPSPLPTTSSKHEQAVSWRSGGRQVASGPSTPAPTPFGQKLGGDVAPSGNAVKGFNGVFGNKVVPSTPTPLSSSGTKSTIGNAFTSPVQNERNSIDSSRSHSHGPRSSRSSSGSSGSGSVIASRSASDANSSGTLTGNTSPMSPNGEGEGCRSGVFYDALPMRKTMVGSPVRGGTVPAGDVRHSTPLRQPHGPPGGPDELGSKNFASRIRKKAVNDLGLLGRRVAQTSTFVQ